ncbi:hypothetical protein Tco_0975022 [Tanacetum coccineum]|uniref:Uncharacterized protein n=1 Tax=Tanacetum coccineum TaxID=301880 RepID=A0ABQ5ED77_9ASTR
MYFMKLNIPFIYIQVCDHVLLRTRNSRGSHVGLEAERSSAKKESELSDLPLNSSEIISSIKPQTSSPQFCHCPVFSVPFINKKVDKVAYMLLELDGHYSHNTVMAKFVKSASVAGRAANICEMAEEEDEEVDSCGGQSARRTGTERLSSEDYAALSASAINLSSVTVVGGIARSSDRV